MYSDNSNGSNDCQASMLLENKTLSSEELAHYFMSSYFVVRVVTHDNVNVGAKVADCFPELIKEIPELQMTCQKPLPNSQQIFMFRPIQERFLFVKLENNALDLREQQKALLTNFAEQHFYSYQVHEIDLEPTPFKQALEEQNITETPTKSATNAAKPDEIVEANGSIQACDTTEDRMASLLRSLRGKFNQNCLVIRVDLNRQEGPPQRISPTFDEFSNNQQHPLLSEGEQKQASSKSERPGVLMQTHSTPTNILEIHKQNLGQYIEDRRVVHLLEERKKLVVAKEQAKKAVSPVIGEYLQEGNNPKFGFLVISNQQDANVLDYAHNWAVTNKFKTEQSMLLEFKGHKFDRTKVTLTSISSKFADDRGDDSGSKSRPVRPCIVS